jgi:hypothetical protein
MAPGNLDRAVEEIRASDAVVLMGAGVSFAAGMPLAGQLSPLLWHALDSNPKVLELLCAELGSSLSAAKSVVGDDWKRISRSLELIKSDKAAYRTFKQTFCELNKTRAAVPSPPHTALARLVHARKVIEVISFNWDTLLECAFQDRFGFGINSQEIKLWKPHGDCLNPDLDWVLPHEDGRVPAELIDRLTNLARVRPRVLLIIGYSERDACVVHQIIVPLASQWRVFRVSPTALGEGAIKLPAGRALEALAEQLVTTPDVPGWSIITFENQRGLEAAIAGERLGPRDVEACPRLPHFNTALKKLSLLNAVEIAGESGSGKSITVWQLAYEFHRKGWQVLRLDAGQRPMLSAAIDALKAQGWKTVAVADDSQVFQPVLISRLRDLASAKLKIVLGTTDPKGEQQEAVRAAAKVAVEALANHFRSHRETVLQIARQLDSRIGDGFMDVRIEWRIDEAAKEQTPWQFAYVLRGGTRKVRDLVNAAHDFQQADLLLVAIAARQLATVDAGSSISDLVAAAQQVGRNEAWVHSSLEALSKQRAILVSDVIRCLHLRSATSIIEVALEVRTGTDYQQLVSLLQATLQNESLPLQGISWLLQCFWRRHDDAVVLAEIKSQLISRCIAAQTHLEIRGACLVISRLLGRRDEAVMTQVLANQELLRSWIIGADATDASAIGDVINNMHNDSAELTGEFLERIDPKGLAEKIGAAPPISGYVWGHFIGRVSLGRKDWRSTVASHLPRDHIRRAVAAVSSTECEELPRYINEFSGFDFDFALELFELAAPTLSVAIRRDSMLTFHTLFDSSHWLLGERLFYDKKPTRRQRAISKRIFDGIDSADVIRGIVTCPYGEWENYARLLGWVRRAHPAKHREIVQAMDWAALDNAVSGRLEKPGREFGLLMWTLVLDSKTAEPVATWLLKHAPEMKEIGARIAVLSPEAARVVLSNRGTINLAHDHASWFVDAMAIARLAHLDEGAAKEVLTANVTHIAKGIAELSLAEGMPDLLRLIAGETEILNKVFDSVDLQHARERWPRSLTDHRSEERKTARAVLRLISEQNHDELGQLARRLLREVRYRKVRERKEKGNRTP